MSARDELLLQVNAAVPPDVDWKAGAQRYVQHFFDSMGRDAVRTYSMSKPLATVGEDPHPGIVEFTHYIYNFANALALIEPKRGARVLDVACGGGWVSHYLTKLGYRAYGIDISADFVDLARERLAADRELRQLPADAQARFEVHDIETTPLPSHLEETFDVIWLESCLHHFMNPVSALEHLAKALAPNGVILLIEGENRRGPIKEEYLKVMRETETLERPYARTELERALSLAGLSHVEFLGTINGWYSPHDPAVSQLGETLVNVADQMNLAICAKRSAPLDALFPHRRNRVATRFGRGFHSNENGYRWSAPFSEITFDETVTDFRLTIHSPLPAQRQQAQTVVAYGAAGELARAILTAEAASVELVIGTVSAGDRVTLHSTEAFSPSWTGGADTRLLSFYVSAEA